MAWGLRLPHAGQDVALELVIDRGPHRETWTRWFASRRVATDQYERGGLLVERFGPLEFEFQVDASTRSLQFDLTDTRFRLGPVGLKLPRSIGPRIHAVTAATEYEGQVGTFVRVSMPLVGLLLSFRGRLELTP